MVTFTPQGRMGNFLFQAASSWAYAKDHGLEFSVPSITNDVKWNPIYLQHLVNPNFNEKLETIEILESCHEFQHFPFEESWRNKNIKFVGYFQTEKYFKKYRDEVLKLFGFYWKLNKDVVSVHVRRTDYLKYPDKHPPISVEWLTKAMDIFPDKKFIFFSDDIPWCKERFSNRDNCSFSEGKNEVDDLISMSCCEHNICSASTFAWWGYWLNQNPKKVGIFPELWFVPGHGGLNTDDIVPPECIKL